MDVLAWLREHHAVHGWFMCYDADDELLRARPQSCLAHLMGADLASTQAALKSSGLIGQGVKASKRLALLGKPMHTVRTKLRSRSFNFLWVGSADEETPGWSPLMKLDGQAQRAPPPVAHWNRRATRGQEATPHAAASSSTRGTATTPFGDAALDAGAPPTRPTLPVRPRQRAAVSGVRQGHT